MILKLVAMTQQALLPSEFRHGIYESFKIESVSSSGRIVRPSVRPLQWLARVELRFRTTTGQPGFFGPFIHGPYQWQARVALMITTTTDQFYPTRKEGRAQNSSETSTRRRKLSAFMVIKKTMWQITFLFFLDFGISSIILMQVQNFGSQILVLSRNRADFTRKAATVQFFY